MNHDDSLETLRKILKDREKGRHGARLRKALLAVVVPASASFAVACYAATASGPDWIYEPTTEACTNRLDDDYDGFVDCDDSECSRLEICLGCRDELDNDRNGAMDCGDLSCRNSEGCIIGLCGDDEDNDGDGLVDCLDPDCAGVDPCA